MSGDKLEHWIGVSSTVVMLIFCLTGFYVNIERVLQSSDTAWLIKTGQFILLHGLPTKDPFSWTCSQQPIVIYQWLFSVAASVIYQCGGLWLVGLISAILVAFIYLCFLPASMLVQRVKPVYVFGLLSLTSTPIWFWARPQLISFLLIAAFTYLLERYRLYGFQKTMWILPLLMVLWVNVHSFWFIGLIMVALYLLPAIKSVKVACLLLLCFVSILANPYGAGIISYNLSFLSEPDFFGIWELQPNLLLAPQANIGILTYFILAWAAIIAGRAKVPLAGLLLAGAGTIASLMFYRFIPVAVLLTWPYVGVALSQFSAFRNEAAIKSKRLLVLPVLAIVCACLFFVIRFPVNKPVWFTHSNSNLEVIKYLKQHPDLTKRMLCGPALGCSQILEDLGPVFIDTRFDFYGQDFCTQYNNCLQAKGNWQAYIDKWQVKSLCIENTCPLYGELLVSHFWRKKYDDGNYSIWLPLTK